MGLAYFGQPIGQGWEQVAELALALVLSAAIGVEREIRQKSAGLRTHTLVGFASALFMLVSKFGFSDVLGDHVTLDPSRVAAQVVSGLGFIGGGLIFVRQDVVRGLTTAATIWLTAAVGMAAGAGLWLPAVLATGGHFLVTFTFGSLADLVPRSKYASSRLHLSYLDGRGVLRLALAECANRGFTLNDLSIERGGEYARDRGRERGSEPAGGIVSVWLTVHGPASVSELTMALAEIDGVIAVSGSDVNTSA
jgi:putative Mg2+ transporter-C (MgtC) family protein